MDESNALGYTDPVLIEYYDTTIKGLNPGAKPFKYLTIDASAGKTIDMEEYARFIKEFGITYVDIRVDDASQLGIDSEDHSGILNYLPISKLCGISIKGNLDGFEFPKTVSVRGESGIEEQSFEELLLLDLDHDGQEPAQMGDIAVPKELNILNIKNISQVKKFDMAPDRTEDHAFIVYVPKLQDLKWEEIENSDKVTGLSTQEQIEPTRENIEYVMGHFPNLAFVNFAPSKEVVEAKSAREAAFLLKCSNRVQFEPDKFEEIRSILAEGNDKSTIRNTVPFDDGLYYRVQIPVDDAISKEDLEQKLTGEEELSEDDIYTIQINGLKDLSTEEAKKLQELAAGRKVVIAFNGPEVEDQGKACYSLDQYIAIRERTDELLEGIDENMPEKERFAEIYKRVSTAMYYDYQVAYPQSHEDTIYSRGHFTSASNMDSLMMGKGMCAAYAFVMQQACELKGLESKYVSGPVFHVASHDVDPNAYVDPDDPVIVEKELDGNRFITRGGHAWIKIQLDGVWYNVDPTWDSDALCQGKIPSFALLSDKTLLRSGRKENTTSPECTEDYPEEELAELFDVKRTRNPFKRFAEFLKGINPTKRTIHYDPEILEFTTGEKLSDFMPEKKPSLRERFMNLFRPKQKALPAPEPEKEQEAGPGEEIADSENQDIIDAEATTETISKEEEKPPVWELSDEEKKNINVEEAVKMTNASKDDKEPNKDDKKRDGR